MSETIKTAFLFPGQGSQFEGMGQDLANESPHAMQKFQQAQEVLGWDILALKKGVQVPSLDNTLFTQPAVYVVSCAVAGYLQAHGIRPDVTAGHSAGEFAALTLAGAWDFITGLKLISQRACLMHKTAVSGAMAAVLGLDADVIREVCERYPDGVVQVANYNSPKQTVITGETQAVADITPFLKERGAKRIVKLPVSGAFHSPLMKKAQDAFRDFMQDIVIQTPKIIWVSNHTAQPETDPSRIKEQLIAQFCSSVRWVESMGWIEKHTARSIETGPGEVLCGLAKACCEGYECLPTSTLENCNGILTQYEQTV